MMRSKILCRVAGTAAVAVVLLLFGCGQAAKQSTPASNEAPPQTSIQGAAPKGGIPVPPAVRDNLGITFATVERRVVAQTRRVPGQFELRPEARREHHALLGGRVTLYVEQFQAVAPGDLLATVDSPQWRQIQHEAVEAEGEITIARATLDVVRAQREEAATALAHQEQRIKNLSSVNARKAELESAAAALRSSLPRLDAEIRAQEAAVQESIEHYESRLNTLGSLTGIPADELRRAQGENAAWRAITALQVHANEQAVVETLNVTNGGWLSEGDLILTTVDPKAIRFHAEAPQSDIGLFHDNQPAMIVPPQGSTIDMQESMAGMLRVGLTAHEEARTISLYVQPDALASWAKAGVSGFLEITLGEDAQEQWAIPLSAVVQDGLEHVFYRRDPNDPDRVLRVIADLGANDGRWVALRSGVKEGDQVVLDGVYALKLTSSAQQAPAGYHYHADGSLHKNH